MLPQMNAETRRSNLSRIGIICVSLHSSAASLRFARNSIRAHARYNRLPDAFDQLRHFFPIFAF